MKERKAADDTAKAAREGKVKEVNEWKDKFNTAVNGARKKYKVADLAKLKEAVASYETKKAAGTGGITAEMVTDIKKAVSDWETGKSTLAAKESAYTSWKGTEETRMKNLREKQAGEIKAKRDLYEAAEKEEFTAREAV